MIVLLNVSMHASVCLVMHIAKIFIIFTLACVCEERMGLQGFITLFVLFLSILSVMVEEFVNTEITSEQFELEDGNVTPNSTERLVIIKSGPKILSRYLSDRISSCHDACKYGTHHSAEAKPWSAAWKMAITGGRKVKVTKEVVISSPGMKKNSKTTSNPSPTSQFGKPNHVVVKDQSSLDGTVPSEKKLPPADEMDVSMDHDLSDIKKEQSEGPSVPVQKCSSNKPSREIVKTKSSSGSSIKNKSESIKQRRISSIGDKKISVPPSGPVSSKHYTKKSSTVTSNTSKNLKGVYIVKNQKTVVEVEAEANSNDNLQEKILHVDEPSPEANSNDNLQEKILNVDEPSPDHKDEESTLACEPPNLSLVSPSSGDKILKQDSQQIIKSGSPASPKKSTRHAGRGVRATKSPAPSPLSPRIKGKRGIQNTVIASSSLSPLSRSASSRRTFKHAEHGIRPTKSLAPSPVNSGIIIKRHMQNKVHKVSSSSASQLQLASSSKAVRLRPTKSLAPSALSSGAKVNRRMQHTMQSTSSPSSSPSHSELPISPSNSPPGKQNGATFKRNKTGNCYPGENLRVGYKIRQKRGVVVGAGNKVIPARKLSFRRGEVIELQPQNNIPRRLKFKPARLLSDVERERIQARKWIVRRKEGDKEESNDAEVRSENFVPRIQTVGAAKKRNFRRKLVDGSKIDGSESGSQQVVLRHQNVLGKKVTRRLYNNVIEETASKLAEELRQSKVKALVGAFETVISLDSHPQEDTSL